MEYKIHNLIERFDNIKNTHPNISKIWSEYLSKKISNLENIINQSEGLISNIEDNTSDYKDMPIIMILLLLNSQVLT